MLDAVEELLETLVGTVVRSIEDGVVQAILAPFFYVPGFVLLFLVTLGHYPPEFLGERGVWPSILSSVAMWLGVAIYLGVLPI